MRNPARVDLSACIAAAQWFSSPDLVSMVGPLSGLLLLFVICTAQVRQQPHIQELILSLASQDEDCSMFKKEYCNLRLDKILMLDTDIAGAPECQVGPWLCRVLVSRCYLLC